MPGSDTWDGHPEKLRPLARRAKRRTRVGWFVHRYGWRAYALPVLMAVTVVVTVQTFRPATITVQAAAEPTAASRAPSTTSQRTVVTTTTQVTQQNPLRAPTRSSAAPSSAAPVSAPLSAAPAGSAPAAAGLAAAPDPNGTFGSSMQDGDLPPGGGFVAQGAGTFHTVPGSTEPYGDGPEEVTYSVDVEDGVQGAEADMAFAHSVDTTLAARQSWTSTGRFTLQRIDSGTPTFRVTLTSQMTLRGADLCFYSIPLEASCYRRSADRVVINNARWARGATAFDGDIGSYRVYAINHEVGHALGYPHEPCGEDGGLAPVMMQQSFSTSNDYLFSLDPEGTSGTIPEDHKVCRPNPYPDPTV